MRTSLSRGCLILGVNFLCGFLYASDRCSAKFQVFENSTEPAKGAQIRVVEGMEGRPVPPIPAKHTGADGTATFDNLSKKKTPRLLFAVSAGARSTTVLVNLNQECHGTYRAILPDRAPSSPAER